MTFSELQTDALDLLQELVNHPYYSLDKLKHYINRGYYDFVRRTKCIESSADINTVANQFSYTVTDSANLAYLYIPTSFRFIDYPSTTTVGKELYPYQGGYNNLPKNYLYGEPSHYWVNRAHTRASVRVGTWPICSTSGDIIRIEGYFRPSSELGSDSNVPDMPLEYHDALVFYAVSRMFQLFAHLRPTWRQKAADNLAVYMEYVNGAIENMHIQDNAPMSVPDLVEYDGWDY